MAKWCWVGVSVDAGLQPRSARRCSLLAVRFLPVRPLRQSHRPSDLPVSRIDRPIRPSHPTV